MAHIASDMCEESLPEIFIPGRQPPRPRVQVFLSIAAKTEATAAEAEGRPREVVHLQDGGQLEVHPGDPALPHPQLPTSIIPQPPYLEIFCS